jgi:hypothetical protein
MLCKPVASVLNTSSSHASPLAVSYIAVLIQLLQPELAGIVHMVSSLSTEITNYELTRQVSHGLAGNHSPFIKSNLAYSMFSGRWSNKFTHVFKIPLLVWNLPVSNFCCPRFHLSLAMLHKWASAASDMSIHLFSEPPCQSHKMGGQWRYGWHTNGSLPRMSMLFTCKILLFVTFFWSALTASI